KPVKSILKPADIQPAETLAERPSPDSEKENYPATTSITKTSTAKERQLITRKARIQPKVKQAITPYQPPAAAHKEAEAEIASAYTTLDTKYERKATISAPKQPIADDLTYPLRPADNIQQQPAEHEPAAVPTYQQPPSRVSK